MPSDMVAGKVTYQQFPNQNAPGDTEQQDDDKTLKRIQGKLRSRQIKKIEDADLRLTELQIQQQQEEAQTAIEAEKIKRQSLVGGKQAVGTNASNKEPEEDDEEELSGAVKLDKTDAEFVKGLPAMKEEDRLIALSAWKTLKEKASAKGGDPLQQMTMLAFVKSMFKGQEQGQSPVSSIKETSEALGSLIERFAPAQGPDTGDKTLATLVALKDLGIFGQQNQQNTAQKSITETIKELKDADLIMTQKDFREALATMRPDSAAPIVDTRGTDLELERIRSDTNLQIKKIDSDQALAMAKLEIDKKKTDALTGLGERLAGAIGGAMAEGEVAGLEARGATELSGSTAPRAGPKDMIEVKCLSCGRPIPVPEPGTARDIKCTSCGAIMGYSPS